MNEWTFIVVMLALASTLLLAANYNAHRKESEEMEYAICFCPYADRCHQMRQIVQGMSEKPVKECPFYQLMKQEDEDNDHNDRNLD